MPNTALRPDTAWEKLLHAPAIIYPRCAPENCYWNPDLLVKWQNIYPTNEVQKLDTSSVSYASLLILASYAASILDKRLLDVIPKKPIKNSARNENDVRIGLSIPEGPFLPLFVLVIHALNATGSESFHPKSSYNAGDNCKNIVLIPMEADEAPERLKHILADSDPNIILVAPGKDVDSLVKIIDENQPIELVCYTTIVQEALSLINEDMPDNAILERLYSPAIRDTMVDSLRYSHAIPGCWDAARMVAWGRVRIDYSLNEITPADEELAAASVDVFKDSSFEDFTLSHIVYTSGTTGKPKGCISSIKSLQHYIRAKNKAHGISNKSTVFLASAITFDPCFSDILATFAANGTLAISSRGQLYGYPEGEGRFERSNDNTNYHGITKLLRRLEVTHVLCTPTLWATVEGEPPNNIPSLQVVALGGEPIPKAMRARWARHFASKEDADDSSYNREYPRLLATYGVTEACVYQTCGEVFQHNNKRCIKTPRQGQNVGQPLLGTNIHICRPLCGGSFNTHPSLEFLQDNDDKAEVVIGEVLLSGAQVDITSSYLNLPSITRQVFVEPKEGSEYHGQFFYRTGDLGYVDRTTKDLHIIGRIKGDGMVKVNGVRIELAEVESAVVDDIADERKGGGLVIDCLATTIAVPDSTNESTESDSTRKQLVAYCIVSSICKKELKLEPEQLKKGLIVQHGALLAILSARCDRKIRKGCSPSFFVLVDRLPLSPTGKRDRSRLPPLYACELMRDGNNDSVQSLWELGKTGSIVADKVCECLNLQAHQKCLVTRGSNFFQLGGDSLSATRVCRGLYAIHHGVLNSRNLGGETGTLDGPFAAKHLLSFPTLADYVQFLDAHSAFNAVTSEAKYHNSPSGAPIHTQNYIMHDYLIESVSLGHTCMAASLLDLGIDANPSMDKKARLGKVKDRNKQRIMFRASPLHLACVRGEPFLVKKLLASGCKSNTPDAQGSFPIHLACSRTEVGINVSQNHTFSENQEDLNRLKCVKMLLETTPISIKDGNKQTIIHCAARSGHCILLKYIMIQWKIKSEEIGLKFKSHNNEPGKIFDWYDRWFRTPVHWAVLNQRIDALGVLLYHGASASPAKPKSGVSKRSTNVIIETPLEMCSRLYGDSDIGKQISSMLDNAS